MTKAIDMTGRKYGRLTVVSKSGRTDDGKITWLCLCDCGGSAVVCGQRLRSGGTRSCGCIHHEMLVKTKSTHRHTANGRFSRTYNTWAGMLTRCTNPKTACYSRYGARGITVCEEWKVFDNFLRDMGERPEGKTLDRINNCLGYSKENCRWATAAEQGRNNRRNRMVTAFGQTMCVVDWAAKTGINRTTINTRLDAGVSPEEAVTPGKRSNRRKSHSSASSTASP